jgi:hypothetical protein
VKFRLRRSEIDAARQFKEQIGFADLNNSNCRRQFVHLLAACREFSLPKANLADAEHQFSLPEGQI